jgi:hypothetical protein
MHRMTRLLALAVALSLAACNTAASARRAALRRGLDEARVSRSPAEIWPEVQRFLYERGYPLVGDDRAAIGQKPQGAVGRALARGFETRVRADGSRVLETDQDRARLRVRAEARPAPEGGSRVRLTLLKEMELNSLEVSEQRADELELALLQRLDPAAAARAAGEAPAVAAASAALAEDPWAAVRPLLGSWVGSGPAGGASVHWTFAFTEGGKFLEVRGSPLLFAGPTARSGPDEELGRISRDASGGMAWSQFTYGGQVDRWLREASGPERLVFLAASPESLPAGERARITFRPDGADGLVAALELAPAGQDFGPAGEVRLARGAPQ